MAADRRAARLGVLAVVATLMLGALGARLWFLQTVESEALQASVDQTKTKTVPLVPQRGRIFDADGRILAGNDRMLTVAVDWDVISRSTDRAELFSRLSGWLEMPVEEMEARYDSERYSRYLPMPIKEDVDEPVAVALQERVEDFPGLSIIEDTRRVYPYAPLASHVLGYLGAITEETLETYLDRGYERNEIVGQAGIELEWEQQLHGKWGKAVYEVDAANRIMRTISVEPPINGYDIQLSIDLDLQQYAEQILQTQLRNRQTYTTRNPIVEDPNTREKGPMDPNSGPIVPYEAPAGSVVVMNHDNGQVVAMASYPTFDNRWMQAEISGDKFQELFPQTEDPDEAVLTNRAIQGQYNLGSAFKPFTAYAALSTGLIGSQDYYEDTGTYTIRSIEPEVCAAGVRCVLRNATCQDGLPCVYGPVNLRQALAVSSDAFFYRIGEEFYLRDRELMQEQIRLFGFGEDTGIDLPFEWGGRVPTDAVKEQLVESGAPGFEEEVPRLQVGDNILSSIGQGLMAGTPLHLAVGYGSIINGGRVLTPRVVQTVYEPGVPDGDAGYADLSRATVLRTIDAQARRVPMDPDLSQPIIEGLRQNVTGPGVNDRSTTAEELWDVNYPETAIRVAGKTGTAQGFKSFPWNDSSAFGAFSLDPAQPWTVTSYLEKAGAGSTGAAPIVKCIYLALSRVIPTEPVVVSDPLDLTSADVARPEPDTSLECARSSTPGTVPRD